jgi:hypothetical protein
MPIIRGTPAEVRNVPVVSVPPRSSGRPTCHGCVLRGRKKSGESKHVENSAECPTTLCSRVCEERPKVQHAARRLPSGASDFESSSGYSDHGWKPPLRSDKACPSRNRRVGYLQRREIIRQTDAPHKSACSRGVRTVDSSSGKRQQTHKFVRVDSYWGLGDSWPRSLRAEGYSGRHSRHRVCGRANHKGRSGSSRSATPGFAARRR